MGRPCTPHQLKVLRQNALANIERLKTRTHCKNGHPFAATTRINNNGHRLCKICSNISCNKQRAKMPKPEKIEQIMAALREGKTERMLIKNTAIVPWLGLKTFQRSDHPEARTATKLIERNRLMSLSLRAVRLPNLRINVWLNTFGVDAVNHAVPRNMPDHMRDEMRAELLARLWSGEILPNELAAAVKTVRREHYNAYDLLSKFGKHNSLDAVMFDDGRATLHETANRSIWDMG